MKCPICGSNLYHERVDDGVIRHEIDAKTNQVSETANKSNGYDDVGCITSREHEIPMELKNKVIERVCDEGWL